ncbi:MAG TPA: hypothetical protein VNV36_12325 [Pseudomonas sp.]|uniref:hypothetical protein n=1 Tax=Pseudomonas sp. TaxID=306 RepID=UPI002C418928|nr:hypothetical protein [Pseudomonas sp.]HWH87546.1 hypothetical protein [Pseudomonas sp.]
MRENKALISGKCKNQTKAPKSSAQAVKQAFDAHLYGTAPARTGSFEPKWVGF